MLFQAPKNQLQGVKDAWLRLITEYIGGMLEPRVSVMLSCILDPPHIQLLAPTRFDRRQVPIRDI